MKKFTHNCALITLLSISFFASANPAKPGGGTTTSKQGHNAFSMPASNLDMLKRMDFSVGNSFFRNPWVIAPATTDARDGLGPLFNTNACQGCHIKDGRGKPREEGDSNAVSMLVRLSIPATTPEQKATLVQQGVIPEPVYGGQLQDMSIPGVAPEGQINISYTEQLVTFADGTEVSLRQPKLTIEKLNYGPMHPDVMMSARVAPVMIGLGLLETISEADLLAHADPEDSNKDGISGKANRVWNTAENKSTIGRFGWKAGQPTLMQQNAGAFAGDMGLTSSFNLADDCTPAQKECLAAPHGGKHEASEKVLKFVEFYTQHLAVPARRNMKDPQVQQGQALFQQAQCQSCHVASYTTAKRDALPALSEQVIYPYSDLLLHDMGPGLADNRPEFLANGQEWRTPPLWGLGYLQEVNGHTFLLHDGRARNIMEAILWHGGEAESAKQAVLQFDKAERDALIRFLESL
ncbi:di-heme oxidoreductase family protein [Motilimonas pumila]|uniref:Thiol oxidoreductase n=1 Tax=Motilimonas pumila TaxID=2303987 RepID=A0A418YDJ1_9GAMM|nr:di-heme oxidoredictase family protein [Motilimonas pumila]RJG42612.1 thiol oxidoreductase [Motilimonas pumila]